MRLTSIRRGEIMKWKLSIILILCGLTVVPAPAQTQPSNPTNVANPPDWILVGHGTAGTIPRFVAPYKLADSDIIQSSTGNIGIGTSAPLFPLHIFSNNTVPPPGQSSPITLFVETPASVNTGSCSGCAIIGIEGLASTATPGANVIGVQGVTFSPSGIGVLGNHPVVDGGGGGGVLGLTNATNGFAYAIRGDALGTTGSAVAVFGSSFSPAGSTAYFVNRAMGDIIHGAVSQNLGPDTTVFRVDGTGRVFADGGFQPSGADFAESMDVKGDRAEYVAGDLLVIDTTGNRRLTLAQEPYSTLVAGIYSTKPGMLGNTHKIDEHAGAGEVPLAVVGIVPCKVSAENGPIQPGDLLVTSTTPGHAMKGTDRNLMLGAVVGKALEPMQKGTGIIQVLVTLQ